MNDKSRVNIRCHALETPALEVCGLIVADGRREKLIRCRNISTDPARRFRIPPEEYAAAEQAGTIIAIYHSHPNGPNGATPADQSACEASGLPWWIYSVPADNFTTIEPKGFKAPFVGREFCWGVHDCGTLVADYYREELGITLTVEPYEEGFWKQPGHKPYLDKFLENGFVLVEDPREHDVFLMQLSADTPNHAAIVLESGMILHHVQGRLSCRDVYGGYWRQITRHILRHKTMMNYEG